MGHSRCSVCLTRRSSRFFVVLCKEIVDCFGVRVDSVNSAKVCASCRRRLTRWRNFEEVSVRPTMKKGYTRAAEVREQRRLNITRSEMPERRSIVLCIYDLPVEIIVKILTNLSAVDIISVSLSSKKLFRVANVPTVWKNIAKRDFPYAITPHESYDYRSLYRSLHRVNKVNLAERRYLSEHNLTQASMIDDLETKVANLDHVTSELSHAKEKLKKNEKTIQIYDKLSGDRDPLTPVTQEQEQVRSINIDSNSCHSNNIINL